VKLLGKYNFNEILKQNEVGSLALESYFIILKKIPEHMDQLFKDFKFPEMPLSSTKANNDPNYFAALSIFYNQMNKVTQKPANRNYSLYYREDMISTGINNYFGRMDKYINLNTLIYKLSKYGYQPSALIRIDLLKDYLFNIFESLLDYSITLINLNLITIANVEDFFKILNQMDESNFYDTHFQDLILNNIEVYEKLLTVVTFIMNPQLYYYNNIHIEKIEKINNFLLHKYSLKDFKRMDENVEKKLLEEVHQIENEKFTMSLRALTKNQINDNFDKDSVDKTINSSKSIIFFLIRCN
jgi:hypothetical protein